MNFNFNILDIYNTENSFWFSLLFLKIKNKEGHFFVFAYDKWDKTLRFDIFWGCLFKKPFIIKLK